jgi:hypothetical protein
MMVFISWSGEQSRSTAEALADWLPLLFQSVRPWVSSRDLRAGSRWALELPKTLESATFGVLCVTRQNQASPWLLYEAGALSKSLKEGKVVPYLLDLAPSDLLGPLAQFQAVVANLQGTRALIDAIANAHPGNQRPAPVLEDLIDVMWPRLESRLQALRGAQRDLVAGTQRTGAGPSVIPPEIQDEIESAEASEAIGDVWTASDIYWNLSRKLKDLGLVELKEEVIRRGKKLNAAAAAIMRGD